VKVGDLIQVREEVPFGPPVGAIGIVELVQIQKVCVKGGLIGRSPEDGGPVHAEEKCIMAMFGNMRERVSTHYDRYDIVAKV